MSIFGTNSLKKLQNILKKVDDKDIHNYFRFERMKQGYSAANGQEDKLYKFFSGINTSSKNIHEKAKSYFEGIERDARSQPVSERLDVRPIVYTEIYSKYSEYVYSMVQLSGVYDFFNDDKRFSVNSDWGGELFDEDDTKKMRSLVEKALHDYPMGKRDILGRIDNYEKEMNKANRTQLLKSLIFMIKRIALDTKDYIEYCTKPILLKFRRKYKSVYDALRKIDMREKAWPDKGKCRISPEQFEGLSKKLTQLGGMLFEEPKASNADALGGHIMRIFDKLGEYNKG